MGITNLEKDTDQLTLTVTADYDAPVERVWELWADTSQLARWWGPPTWPATFVQPELVEGATVNYFMTGPDGAKAHGWWRMKAVEPPHFLSMEDGFGDADGQPDTNMPTMNMSVHISEHNGGSRMVLRSEFASREAMDRMTDMQMEEGLRASVGQIDAVLAG